MILVEITSEEYVGYIPVTLTSAGSIINGISYLDIIEAGCLLFTPERRIVTFDMCNDELGSMSAIDVVNFVSITGVTVS